jgi:hypothetical protein
MDASARRLEIKAAYSTLITNASFIIGLMSWALAPLCKCLSSAASHNEIYIDGGSTCGESSLSVCLLIDNGVLICERAQDGSDETPRRKI